MSAPPFDLPLIKREIYQAIVDCSGRGLVHSAKWLAELNFGMTKLPAVDQAAAAEPAPAEPTAAERLPVMRGLDAAEADAYHMAKSFFDCREYARCAHFTRSCSSPAARFLHLYATYMAREKRRLDHMTDKQNMQQPLAVSKDMHELVQELRQLHVQRKLDGYGLYLYGVVLKRINLTDAAVRALCEAVRDVPTLWSAWLELSALVHDRERLARLPLPEHWMRRMFTAQCMVDLFQNDDALQLLEALLAGGFKGSTWAISQMAIAHHNKRNVDDAIATFQHIQDIDPFRLENLDIYSNLLFVKESKKDMAFLAQRAVEINKYRPETCCIIGNYYSIRSEHSKSITYFQRALKLDPQYLSAWTLMGHEFMELKNTNAAIQSYRKAVEVSRREYRAWYGLGQAYEILKMPAFCLHYYKIAQQMRPNDSRMLVALGEAFEKIGNTKDALRCYRKACNVGDIEGIALLRFAELQMRLGDKEAAVPAFLEYCLNSRAANDTEAKCRALLTLGNYYEGKGELDLATHYAYECLSNDETKQEARALLKTLENRRIERNGSRAAESAQLTKTLKKREKAKTAQQSWKDDEAERSANTDDDSEMDLDD